MACNLFWGKYLKPEEYAQLLPFARLNHFPGYVGPCWILLSERIFPLSSIWFKNELPCDLLLTGPLKSAIRVACMPI
jgi:hypothetical protein